MSFSLAGHILGQLYSVVFSLSRREDLVSTCMESGYDADVWSGRMVSTLAWGNDM